MLRPFSVNIFAVEKQKKALNILTVNMYYSLSNPTLGTHESCYIFISGLSAPIVSFHIIPLKVLFAQKRC
jgi:hypothetical protein